MCRAMSMRSKVVEHSRDGVLVMFFYLNHQERVAGKFLAGLRTGNGQ